MYNWREQQALAILRNGGTFSYGRGTPLGSYCIASPAIEPTGTRYDSQGQILRDHQGEQRHPLDRRVRAPSTRNRRRAANHRSDEHHVDDVVRGSTPSQWLVLLEQNTFQLAGVHPTRSRLHWVEVMPICADGGTGSLQ